MTPGGKSSHGRFRPILPFLEFAGLFVAHVRGALGGETTWSSGLSTRGRIDNRRDGGVANGAKRPVDSFLLASGDAQRRAEGDISGLGNPADEVNLLVHDELLDTVPASAAERRARETVCGEATALGRTLVKTQSVRLARRERETGAQIIRRSTQIRRRGKTTSSPSNLRVHRRSSSRDHRNRRASRDVNKELGFFLRK